MTAALLAIWSLTTAGHHSVAVVEVIYPELVTLQGVGARRSVPP
jgi:hypothetical protein